MSNEEEELKLKLEAAKQKQKLESPFSTVGMAGPVSQQKRGPGRPRKVVEDVVSESGTGNDAKEVALTQRMQQISRPESNSNPESIREWADKEIHGLLPEAVASLAWDIRYGDAKARAEARSEILRATGVDKKEASAFGKGGQIVINLGGQPIAGALTLPYLQRADVSPQPSNPVVERLSDGIANKQPKKEGE